MKKIKCDVVVVGAGPGGSMAAKTCAKLGLDTVLVERKEEPARYEILECYTNLGIRDYMRIDKKFANPVYKNIAYFPDGTEISTPRHEGYEFGYELNREVFDGEVLKVALKEGFEFMNRTRATGLIRENGMIKGVKAKINEREDVEVISNVVIGADGAEHKVGRWAGIYKRNEDPYLMLQCLLDGAETERDCYYEWLGYEKITDAYFTSSTRPDGKAGLSIMPFGAFHRTRKGQLSDALNYFLKNHPLYKKAKIVRMGGGALSVSPLKKFTTDGLMLVGEAANNQGAIHPGTAGAWCSMDAGVLAGEVAVEAHEEGDFSSNVLSRYEERYNRLHGVMNTIGYYSLKIGVLLPIKILNDLGHQLDENDCRFTDEFFGMFNSPKLNSKILNELKKEGLEIPDMLSFLSRFKKYYRNWWDTFLS